MARRKRNGERAPSIRQEKPDLEMANQRRHAQATHGSHSLFFGTRLPRSASDTCWRFRPLSSRSNLYESKMTWHRRDEEIARKVSSARGRRLSGWMKQSGRELINC